VFLQKLRVLQLRNLILPIPARIAIPWPGAETTLALITAQRTTLVFIEQRNSIISIPLMRVLQLSIITLENIQIGVFQIPDIATVQPTEIQALTQNLTIPDVPSHAASLISAVPLPIRAAALAILPVPCAGHALALSLVKIVIASAGALGLARCPSGTLGTGLVA
jgi:hypothetical protein